jgi:dolichol-phosphate mannosyltransferase
MTSAIAGSRPRPVFSVVIPSHNEADALESLLREIAPGVRLLRLPYEIVVVDDGSTDDTAPLLAALSTEIAELRWLHHRDQFGQSAAILSGVAAAHGEWVVTMDGDGQNDPADIPRIWEVVADRQQGNRPLLVAGRRVVRRDSRRKRWLSWLLNRWSAALMGHEMMDKSCGLKLFRRADFLSLPTFDHMHRFLPGLFAVLDAEVVSRPVGHRPRTQGRSHYGTKDRLIDGLIDVLAIIWLRNHYLPPASRVAATPEPS